MDEQKQRKRRQRRPRLDVLIAEAEKVGKTVSSITLADGTKLTFGGASEPAEETNPWLRDIKQTRQ
jgi:hypothetical protein